MRAADLRRIAAESAGLLRAARISLPAADRVHEIQCPRCRRWVRPRRFDVLCMSCRACKNTLARPARRRAAPPPSGRQLAARRPARQVAPADWPRWDRCPTCDGRQITEQRLHVDGVACLVWRCRGCDTQTLCAARPVAGGAR